jgi:hypothetical protein
VGRLRVNAPIILPHILKQWAVLKKPTTKARTRGSTIYYSALLNESADYDRKTGLAVCELPLGIKWCPGTDKIVGNDLNERSEPGGRGTGQINAPALSAFPTSMWVRCAE